MDKEQQLSECNDSLSAKDHLDNMNYATEWVTLCPHTEIDNYEEYNTDPFRKDPMGNMDFATEWITPSPHAETDMDYIRMKSKNFPSWLIDRMNDPKSVSSNL